MGTYLSELLGHDSAVPGAALEVALAASLQGLLLALHLAKSMPSEPLYSCTLLHEAVTTMAQFRVSACERLSLQRGLGEVQPGPILTSINPKPRKL